MSAWANAGRFPFELLFAYAVSWIMAYLGLKVASLEVFQNAAHSHLSRVVSLPIYQSMTIRNWNTTTTLLRMMEEIGRGSVRD